MASATISKAIQELVDYGMISYKKGNSHKQANIYTVLPESEWKLPTTSENDVLQKLKHFKNESATDLEIERVPPQKLKPKKTNVKRPIKTLVALSGATQLWNYYSDQSKANGIEAVHQGAKTNKLCSNLVEKYGLEKAKRLVDTFLQDSDPFVQARAWSIGLLTSQEQKYVHKLKEKPRVPLIIFEEE